jgi:hypothetical protein
MEALHYLTNFLDSMVTLLQTEKTYEVRYNNKSYTVTLLEDFASNYIQYDIFNNKGMEVEGELELEIITYLETHID